MLVMLCVGIIAMAAVSVAQVEVDPNSGKPLPQPVEREAQPTDIISRPAPGNQRTGQQPPEQSTPANSTPSRDATATRQPAQVGEDAQQPAEIEPGVSLTVYSNADPAGFDPQRFIAQQRMGYNPNSAWQVPGFGVVRDTRVLNLNQGDNVVSFVDVAQFIDPTTVSFRDLEAPENDPESAIKVYKQDFEFDLVSGQKLLEKYIDQEITVLIHKGDGDTERVTGTLMSAINNQLVLQTSNGLRMLNYTNDVQLGELPGGLVTRPTLKWDLWSPRAGDRKVQTAYQTDGITWRSDYNLILSQDEKSADLGAWVTLLNLTGTTFEDASLKLIAGDVQRIEPQQPRPQMMYEMARRSARARPEGFEEKSFFEYHMYTLPWNITVKNNSTQQVALFPTKQDVEVEKVLVYYGLPEGASYWVFPNPQTDRNMGNQSNSKVDVYIRFDNRESNRLGIPLPKGKMRVYKADPADGTLEFVGVDLIDDTPKNQKVLVKIGQSFDVTGQRTQTDYQLNSGGRWLTETIEIKLSNAKDQPQDVLIRENLYRWVNWEIVKKSHDFEKIDSRTVHFPVTVPAGGDVTVTYTVRYSW